MTQDDIQLTPTSYIVLGLLREAGEGTPYELNQIVDATVGHFWSVPRSQLYAEPARLARARLVTENQESGGRRRKRYALTPAGRDALDGWLATPTQRLTELRDLAFLKLFFGAEPLALSAAQLQALRTALTAFQAKLDPAGDGLAGQRQTLEAGIEHVHASIRSWERIAEQATQPTRSKV